MSIRYFTSRLLQPRKVASEHDDEGIIPPRAKGHVIGRMFRPRTDSFHTERAPNGEIIYFGQVYAPGHHISYGYGPAEPHRWFNHDRIDPKAAAASHLLKKCLRLCHLAPNLAPEHLQSNSVGADIFKKVVDAFELPCPDDVFTSIMRFPSLFPWGTYIDQTAPELARGILMSAGLMAGPGGALPPMSIVRQARRYVDTIAHRISGYVALDLCCVTIHAQRYAGGPPAPSQRWREAATPSPEQSPGAFLLSQIEATEDATHLPAYMQIKALHDNQLLSRTFERDALLHPADIGLQARVSGENRPCAS